VPRAYCRPIVGGKPSAAAPKSYVACGLLFYAAGGVKQQANNVSNNEVNLCSVGRGGGGYNP